MRNMVGNLKLLAIADLAGPMTGASVEYRYCGINAVKNAQRFVIADLNTCIGQLVETT